MTFNIGIDVGTRSVRMVVKGRGAVLRESSAVATREGAMIAQGDEALSMLGRCPQNVSVDFPMEGASVGNETALAAWLAFLLKQAVASGLVHRPRLLIARAPDMTPGMMRRFTTMAMEAGAFACAMMRADALAAVGAGIDIEKPRCALVAQAGAGAMSASLICRGRVTACATLPYGFSRADEEIQRALLREHGFCVGLRAAEAAKIALGGAPETLAGFNRAKGFPGTLEVPPETLIPFVTPCADALVNLCLWALDQAEPAALADIAEDGIVLTGGGARVFGLDKRVEASAGIPCRVADDPAGCVARGLETVVNAPDSYENLLEAHQSILEKRLSVGGR